MRLLSLVPGLLLSLAVHAEVSEQRAVLCGAKGSLEARIADCKRKNGSGASKEIKVDGGEHVWKLVARVAVDANQGYGEFWLETASGLVWSPRVSGTFTHDQALVACGEWQLPTADDYRDAESRGLRDVLKGLAGKLYWSSTRSDYETAAYYFSGSGGYVEDGNRDVKRSVRCVVQTRRF